MRPDPRDQTGHDASGRIIYLGDVRRRRVSRRQSSDSDYLAAFVLAALGAWAIWLVVLFNVAPTRLVSYLAFFIPLACALAITGSLLASVVASRSGRDVELRTAFRRGCTLAALVVLNLAFLAAHRWSLPVVAVSVLVVIGADMVTSRRG